jgi:hypothetical protein
MPDKVSAPAARALVDRVIHEAVADFAYTELAHRIEQEVTRHALKSAVTRESVRNPQRLLDAKFGPGQHGSNTLRPLNRRYGPGRTEMYLHSRVMRSLSLRCSWGLQVYEDTKRSTALNIEALYDERLDAPTMDVGLT